MFSQSILVKFVRAFKEHRLSKRLSLLPLLSGLLLALSYNFEFWWPLSLVALIPLFYYLYSTPDKAFRVFLSSWAGGFVFTGLGQSWFWSSLPLDWAGVSNHLIGALGIFFYWFSSALVLSFFIGLFGLVFWKLKDGAWQDFVLAPSVWVIFEYLRSWGYGVFYASDRSVFGPHWTPGFLGYFVSPEPLFIFWARYGGVLLVSAIVCFINFALFRFFLSGRYSNRQRALIVGKLLVILMFFSYSFGFLLNSLEKNKQGAPTITAAVMHTDFPSHFSSSIEEQKEELEKQKRLVEQLVRESKDPDVIVYPEGQDFLRWLTSFSQSPSPLDFFNTVLGQKERLIVDSGQPHEDGKTFSRLYYYNTQSEKFSTYDKILLYPNGEFIPYLASILAQLLGTEVWVNQFNEQRAFYPGTKITRGTLGEHTIGAIFCSEISSPSLYRQASQGSTDLLINVASHSIFNYDQVLAKQMRDMSRLRAVENNKYLLRSVNGDASFAINNFGQVIKQTEIQGDSFLYGEFPLIDKPSFYSRYGDWIVLLAFITSLVLIPLKRR